MVKTPALIQSNLAKRILSSLFLAPLVLGAVYMGGPLYAGTVLLFVSLGIYEWVRLIHAKDGDFGKGGSWLLFGMIYIGGAALSLLYLRLTSDVGLALVCYLLAVVWGTDIGAYVVGRLVGGARLAPKISPNKTWAGFFGGLALAAVFGYGVAVVFGARHVDSAFGFALLLAVVSQLGDLFESWLKRRSGLKESGNLIPGHGGILDRVDGLIPAAIMLALFQVMFGVSAEWW